MINKLFSSVTGGQITAAGFLLCTAVSLIAGFIIALSHLYKNRSSKSYAITVALLPLIVQVVIMLVNGNLGTGIAVAGAFSLVRFRSVPGSAKEILSIFMSMAAGLATGVGYIGIAIVFSVIISAFNLLYTSVGFGDNTKTARELKITVPESLNFTNAVDDLFDESTGARQLKKVKTTNMGSLYQLTYSIKLKNPDSEMEFIDKLRCRNGNLEIQSNYNPTLTEEL